MARILFSIHHPAHVHFFRNAIKELTDDGNSIAVFARDKDVTVQLLESYSIQHEILSGNFKTTMGLVKESLKYEFNLLRKARDFEPDILVSIGSGALTSYISSLIGATSIAFNDTENATLQNRIGYPMVDQIFTPDCYNGDHGTKHVKYAGYHELAYLHPDRFKPDPSVLNMAGLDHDEQFVILRLISWDAIHDVGDSGFKDIVDVVEELEDTGATVRITSEANLPSGVEDRQVSIPPHQIHDLMAFADLYVGESATMAAESSVLGTPAIFVSSSRRGYTDELEAKYGLVFNYSDESRHKDGLNQALKILERDDDENWEKRRQKMLEEKIDTTDFITKTIQKSVRGANR
ncbi:DUF354 domain-containing protein [Natronorubrum sp. JWXQ-INN-674]|uniref:DUF354 domain-containing protein n=1 Tax=Natronorubrum halalkaliphilum TaxID=2691917 RepID=A0A6B0VL68_9EURY|nr:DUF354 domain-containing protein [Natronorubrum halalkaliphilum]MXV61865.1 DUF354 domain-containing protein [Natronorubrum halalkaliphilum]